MKKLLLLSIFFLIASLGISQYHVFSDIGNLTSQKIIQMSDGGFLISAYEYCYTPHVVIIEGCGFATHFVRTNSNGDTLWTKRINVTPWESRLFENDDGSITLVGIANQPYSCDGFVVGPWGLSQIQVLHISGNGELLGEVRFPDNCELVMRDVIEISNNLFVTVGYYISPMFTTSIPEGRLFTMNADGAITNEVTFENEYFEQAKLIKSSESQFQLLFLKENELHLDTYDYQLNLVNSTSTSINENSCLKAGEFYADNLNNGDLCIICEKYHPEDDKNVVFIKYNASLDELVHRSFTIKNITNFVLDENDKIILASTHTTPDTIKNTMITYFNYMGDSLSSIIIPNDGADERPNRMVLTDPDGKFAIAGNVNCCNYDSITGPGRSFLLLEDQITELREVDNKISSISLYPNPTSDIVRIEFSELSKSEQILFRLFTPLGQEVLSKKMNTSTADISLKRLADGLYFYTISNGQKLLKSGKILKN